jgi:ferredoxin
MQQKARELMEAGSARVVIGFAVGTFGRRRPLVARSVHDLDALVWDEACTMNLAGLLTKQEVRAAGPVAIVGGTRMLRSLLQLAAERQIRDGEVVALVPTDGTPTVLATAAAVEEHLALVPHGMPDADRDAIARLKEMSRAERWAWWQGELGRCVKCYACRQTCPMCYCPTCTMDMNRPQWVPVASHDLGNLEYHIVRAMHLAGRCVQCGECGKACPVGIPVHLLTMFAEESAARQFGQRAGHAAKLDYALSTFRPDDKETFIR